MQPINCCYRSLKGKASIVNPVNKLYFLDYKAQQTFLVPAKKKHELGDEHALPLKRVITVIETYFILLLKMRNLSQNSSGQGIKNWKKLVDKIITYCFIEWNNMI